MEFSIPETRGRKTKYPELVSLEVGDSHIFEADAATIRGAIAYHTRKSDKRFVSRKAENGLQVWRVS